MVEAARVRMVVIVVAALAASGCAVGRLGSVRGGPDGVARWVPATADQVWARVSADLGVAGLLVERVRPEERRVRFGWVTIPGDGRLYVTCRGGGPVGNASVRAEVRVDPAGAGSVVSVRSEVQAKVGSGCVAAGRFESWLLDRFGPAVAAGGRPGAAKRAIPD